MVYEYRCGVCGCDIETRQRITEYPKKLLYCPGCERMRPVKRLISKTSFVLKGKAWAKDGYANIEE
jgi:putative FmdB family regulatory protein